MPNRFRRLVSLAMFALTSLGASAQTIFTVTNTNASGPGSLEGVLLAQAAACPASSRIEFAIPAATDPNCDAATGICRIQATDLVRVRCSNTVVDGYTQPGAAPNARTDLANDARIKIELEGPGPGTDKMLQVAGADTGNGLGPIVDVTLKGLALPRHAIELRPANSGSSLFSGGGHVVSGNWLGWHADGTAATGMVSKGLRMYGAYMYGVTIGGPAPADRNLFTHRPGALCCEIVSRGIYGEGVETSLIEGNYFNVSPAGVAVATNGIVLAIGLTGGLSGGTPYSRNTTVRNNVIYNVASNGPMGLGLAEGIRVSRNVVTGHSGFRAWSFFTVATGGTRNDNPPQILAISELPAEVRVYGNVTGPPNANMRLEFFHNSQPFDGVTTSAERFVGDLDVTLDAGGNASFVASLPPDTRNIAASVANLANGDTSTLAQTNIVPGGGPPSISSAPPAGGTQFLAYSHTFTATGTQPMTWSVVSGTLPTGLALDGSTGVLSGTPTVSGTFTFSVRASNGLLPDAVQSASITIAVNQRTLTVAKAGNGTGVVASSPAGISCGTTCSAGFDFNASVTLTPTPAADSVFVGWSGVCTGTNACTIAMSENRSVTARFDKRKVLLSVTQAPGAGHTTSMPAGLNCEPDCAVEFEIGTVVTLTARPLATFRFGGWSGACAGNGLTCTVTMDQAKSVTATYVKQYVLSVAILGSPSTGQVTSSPAGISCPGNCSLLYDGGTVVTLIAVPDSGSIFAGWGNACSATGACVVTLSDHRSVTATFAPAPPPGLAEPQDLNGDGRSDIVYRNASTGEVYRIFANGLTLSGGGRAYLERDPSWEIVGDGDFDGNGASDLLYRHAVSGRVGMVRLGPTGSAVAGDVFYHEPSASWQIVQTPDIDGDGRSDIVWWNSATGEVFVMLMDGLTIKAQSLVYREPNLQWRIVASGDFTGGNKQDRLVWRNASSGEVFLQQVAYQGGNAFSVSGTTIYREPDASWRIIGARDFDGDGKADLLWRNLSSGQVYMMMMDGLSIASAGVVYTEPDAAWVIVAQGDYNGDGRADLLWRNMSSGGVYMMLMNGRTIASQGGVYVESSTTWELMGPGSY